MMQNPLDLTQTDLRGLMEAGQTLANIPGVGGGSSGGIGELLNTAERFLNLFERFNDGFQKAGITIKGLRSAEGLGIDPPVQGAFFPAGPVIEGGVFRPPEQTVTTPGPDPEPEPQPGPAPTVEPVKIYAKALGWLASLPGDMTMKEALELARDNKGMILRAIEKELPSLIGSDDGPGE